MIFIDKNSQEIIDRDAVQQRLMPIIVNRWDDVDSDLLTSVDVEIVEVVDTAPPSVGAPYTVAEAGYDKSAPGIWVKQWSTIQPTLDVARAFASARIVSAYNEQKAQPVQCLGHNWRGGFESAQAVRGLVDLVQHMGGTAATLQPVDADPVELSLADALLVAVAVGSACQPIFMYKEALLRAIKNAADVETVLSISWE